MHAMIHVLNDMEVAISATFTEAWNTTGQVYALCIIPSSKLIDL